MSDKSATESGVENNVNLDSLLERQPSPSDLMRAEIAARAAKQRDDEIVASGGEVVDTSAPEDESKPDESKPDESKPDESKPDESKPDESKPDESKPDESKPVVKLVKIKVDGVEKEVPESSIIDAGIRALQKESAADVRLEEATRLFREAQALVSQSKPEVKPPPKELDGAEIAQAIRLGNDEEALAAIEALRTKPVVETVPPEAIAHYVEQRMEGKKAFESFMSDFPIIAGNEDLMHLALDKDAKLIAGGDKRSYGERYSDIGKSIYALIGKEIPTGKENAALTLTASEKEQRKASITNLRSASVKPGVAGEEKPKTASDVINEMRKQRGQA